MKSDEILKNWKLQKLEQSVPDNFSDMIMKQIDEQKKSPHTIHTCLFRDSVFDAAKLIQALAAIGMSATGIYRATYQVIMILTP